ncbi:hypothetical protein QR685DRAFT_571540 [Neurospora intermedia]|uniref:Uncharacterized protein n=1 Tax=Neurospora intermedia TaxID=5142 RepID=A0ABR3DCL5_NEUIN
MSDSQQRSPRPDFNGTDPASRQWPLHYFPSTSRNEWQQKPKVRQFCRSNSDIRLAQNNFPRLSTRNLASFSFDLDAVTAPRKRPRY